MLPKFVISKIINVKKTDIVKRNEFQQFTKQLALKRQKNKCASCGTKLLYLGQIGQRDHKYGEGARAHHIDTVNKEEIIL